MLARYILSSNRRLLRCISDAPVNSPKAAENEQWLQNLDKARYESKRVRDEVDQNAIQEDKDSKFLEGPGGFKYKIASKSQESTYIIVKSPLSNFTSVEYLQRNKNRKIQQSNFVDLKIVKCRSGNGGNGMVSFFRDAGRSIGPPDGGDGGNGGSVYIQAVPGINTLAKLKNTYIADDGKSGAAGQLDGANGRDILLTVPVGTVVKWCMDPTVVRKFIDKKVRSNQGDSLRNILNSNMVTMQCRGMYELDRIPRKIQLFRNSYEPGSGWLFKGKDEDYHLEKDWFIALNKKVTNHDLEIITQELENDSFPLFGLDLYKPTEKPICLLKGGAGGLGNMHFLTNLIRNPRFAKSGRAGIEQCFLFELKALADLGLVGLPNAGKSTILNQISNARPRVGHWEFTTMHPTIGTVSLGIDKPSFTVADIPGIIKDASIDKGLGLEFLRHIERSNGWVFVISLEKESPIDDLHTLIGELGGMEKVVSKNILVVCNKADIDSDKPTISLTKYLRIEQFCKAQNWDVIPISALNGENIDILLEKMAKCAGKL
ncbi:putative GTPase MTG2 Ecym_5094 [Eremothecium cymbalariae DBVPG|uniref:Obg family GTPase CgtA n=1 Tax=Eremothecium cymbalariae (strain CBS 270.75 / DBVPG 7215 / KCTC 17166 / NRRL Y-17582) TaxID=931890 RepID=I6NCT6_ERECY|nr:hypothetical protein Ecym_5094 [Eremothecium cymbalariae DBVPG\